MKEKYEPTELLFAARARCRCGAGLAYPMNDDEWNRKARMWACSAVLMNTAPESDNISRRGPFTTEKPEAQHDAYEWWCYEIKSEGQPSADGATTRPPGHHVEQKPMSTCKKCGAKWESPSVRPALAYKSVLPCPGCGETSRSPEGYSNPNVDTRFPDVVVEGD